MLFFVVSFFIFVCNVEVTVGNYECEAARICQSTPISTSVAVDCDGYHACESADIYTTNNIYCRGSYGCVSATMNNPNGLFFCQSLFLCAYSTSVQVGNYASCIGEYSCYSAYIRRVHLKAW